MASSLGGMLIPTIPILGWILLCTGTTRPTGQWPTVPYLLFPTEQVCIEAGARATALVAQALTQVGRTETTEITCWCAPIAQGPR